MNYFMNIIPEIIIYIPSRFGCTILWPIPLNFTIGKIAIPLNTNRRYKRDVTNTL